MVSLGRQMLGFAMAIIGGLGTIIICALPMWKVSIFVKADITIIWEGLWVYCLVQVTGEMQCKIYDSFVELPQELLVARALMVISIIMVIFGVLLGIAGTHSLVEKRAKARVAIATGVIFIVAGVLVLIAVSWSANTIIKTFYNPILIFGALYVVWSTAGVLILGGALLCSSCSPKQKSDKGTSQDQGPGLI